MGELTYGTECQERTETQGSGRMSLFQGVANQDAILVGLKDSLALQNNASHTIDGSRNKAGIEFADVLMSFRTKVVALIFVEAQVEFCSVLHHRTVE